MKEGEENYAKKAFSFREKLLLLERECSNILGRNKGVLKRERKNVFFRL